MAFCTRCGRPNEQRGALSGAGGVAGLGSMFLLVGLAMWIFGIGGYLPNGGADEPASAIYLKIRRIFFKSASPGGRGARSDS